MQNTYKILCFWLFFASACVRAEDANYLSLSSPQFYLRSTFPALSDECFPGGGDSACEEVWISTDTRDAKGLRRDTWYFFGYHIAAVGILYMMPESVSGWSDEEKSEYSTAKWWDNVSHPTWDTDDFYLNYVLHPYWGAAYYVRARERGYGHWGGFWYSVLLSSIFEFGAEAFAEQPSIQDLIVTPVLGSMVGTYFVRVRSNVVVQETERGYRTTGEKWVMVLTDPLGSLNRGVDRMFRRDVEFFVQPYVRTNVYGHNLQKDNVVGIQFHLQW